MGSITKQRLSFGSRSYGNAKLSDLLAAATLFDLDGRVPGDGKPAVIYARDRRHLAQAPPGCSSGPPLSSPLACAR
jgi:hypothetical protein